MKATTLAMALMVGDPHSDRVVPPTGFTAQLTSFTSAAMAFLACFALALSVSSGRLADRWAQELSQSLTIRISAPGDQLAVQTQAALAVLETTPGIEEARPLDADEQRALLAPWFGQSLPIEELPVPQLIDVIEASDADLDVDGLRLRLQAEAPGAVIDDHSRWRRPLVQAAQRLRGLSALSLILITGAMAAMVTLAAHAALSANRSVIEVLRQVGARDDYIAKAFVRRFTLRALGGAAVGTIAGMIAVALMPSSEATAGFLTDLGFRGLGWLLPATIPILAGIVAFAATRFAALRTLRTMA
ncbi:MAG: cell division protein FtsX [Rhodobacteraceae bacterium]|nr:cell division protein FtsX [Paracoccaceae bacterium]